MSYELMTGSLVDKKLEPMPTQKLNTKGTARFAFISILQPRMSVDAIVTLSIFQLLAHAESSHVRAVHSPSLKREEDKACPFQSELIWELPMISSDPLSFLPICRVHETSHNQS